MTTSTYYKYIHLHWKFLTNLQFFSVDPSARPQGFRPLCLAGRRPRAAKAVVVPAAAHGGRGAVVAPSGRPSRRNRLGSRSARPPNGPIGWLVVVFLKLLVPNKTLKKRSDNLIWDDWWQFQTCPVEKSYQCHVQLHFNIPNQWDVIGRNVHH